MYRSFSTGAGHPSALNSRIGVPHPSRAFRVQSHDILYKMSRDILYTLRAGATGTEKLGTDVLSTGVRAWARTPALHDQ